MRIAILAAAALCLSTPAFATGGLVCTPEKGHEPAISLVIGHFIPGGVVGAMLREDGRWRSTMTPGDGIALKQAWIDTERTWVDLVDAETGAPAAQLRVRNARYGGTGTLLRGGRSYEVRCRED